MDQQEDKSRQVHHHIVRIQCEVLAFVMAVILGLTIFFATIWLVIKGGPDVGKHLQLLRHYLPGFTVTWGGSFLGLLYGMVIGGAVGWFIGFIYNRIVDLRNR